MNKLLVHFILCSMVTVFILSGLANSYKRPALPSIVPGDTEEFSFSEYTKALDSSTPEATTEKITETTGEATTEEAVDTTEITTTEEVIKTTETDTTESDFEDEANYLYSYPEAALSLVNSHRKDCGLHELSHSSTLDKAAAIRCKELTLSLSHTRPNGSRGGTVLADVGMYTNCWGENLAAGYVSCEEIVNDWLESPTHRDNILDSDFNKCGFCLLSCESTYGYYFVMLFSN